MALPPHLYFRGVRAAIRQEADEEQALQTLSPLRTGVELYNPEFRIVYRNYENDWDKREAVYRWDTRSWEDVFQNGFPPRPRTPNQSLAHYYNLERFVNSAEFPADLHLPDASVFVSTTRSPSLVPNVTEHRSLYLYLIYAPGGIDAALTLELRNSYPDHQEISFAGGISPQYIKEARRLSFKVPPFFSTHLDPTPYPNQFFTPDTTPTSWPRTEFRSADVQLTYPSQDFQLTVPILGPIPSTSTVPSTKSTKSFIDSAISFGDGDLFVFIGNSCLLFHDPPGSALKILKEPQSIGDAFPYLKDTIFAHGIDAAFTASKRNEAYIFRSNMYALINFATDGGSIIQEPKLITDGFSSLQKYSFANGIDAAFSFCTANEAYIFRGNECALINFADDHVVEGPKKIVERFQSLNATIFEDGLDAAFSYSPERNAVYIFKGDSCALINFVSGTTKEDHILEGPMKSTKRFLGLEEDSRLQDLDLVELFRFRYLDSEEFSRLQDLASPSLDVMPLERI